MHRHRPQSPNPTRQSQGQPQRVLHPGLPPLWRRLLRQRKVSLAGSNNCLSLRQRLRRRHNLNPRQKPAGTTSAAAVVAAVAVMLRVAVSHVAKVAMKAAVALAKPVGVVVAVAAEAVAVTVRTRAHANDSMAKANRSARILAQASRQHHWKCKARMRQEMNRGQTAHRAIQNVVNAAVAVSGLSAAAVNAPTTPNGPHRLNAASLGQTDATSADPNATADRTKVCEPTNPARTLQRPTRTV